MKLRAALLGASILVLLIGCGTSPDPTGGVEADPYWGPGVADPDAQWRRIERLVTNKTDAERVSVASSMGNGHYDEDDLFTLARGMLLSMTWRQAAELYPTVDAALKPWLCTEVIQGQERNFRGMSRLEVLRLLGEPDEQGPCDDDWGGVWTLTYSGYGYVSDSTGALILFFDKYDRYLRIGYPS